MDIYPAPSEKSKTILHLFKRKKRRAISEVMGSLIMIAITLIAGAAVFGFVNGQSGNSAQAVGNSANSNINFLNEREVIVVAQMVSSTNANVFVFNNGQISPETIVNMTVYQTNPATIPNYICGLSFKNSTSPGYQVKVGSLSSVHVDLTMCNWFPSTITPPTFVAGNAYTFEIYGKYGSTAQLNVRF
jgi:flagellin-like protein